MYHAVRLIEITSVDGGRDFTRALRQPIVLSPEHRKIIVKDYLSVYHFRDTQTRYLELALNVTNSLAIIPYQLAMH